MNKEQMEKLEAYFSAMEAAGGISDNDIRRYVKREFNITLTKSYIPVLRSRLKKGKPKTPTDRAAKMKGPEEIKLIDISKFIPREGKWKPPYCIYNKGQEMTFELFLTTNIHFVENQVPESVKLYPWEMSW